MLAKKKRLVDPAAIKTARKPYCEVCGRPAYGEPHHKTFPTVLIILDVMAAINHGKAGNIKQMVYWLAAATLSFCVTY